MTTAYDVALKRIKEVKRTGATKLNLIGGGVVIELIGKNRESIAVLDPFENNLILNDDDFTRLWPELSQLSNLTELYLWGNELTSLPTDFSQLFNLTALYLGDNLLTTLPTDFSQLSNLTELYLSGNQIRTLPTNFSQLSNLTVLTLNNNQFITLPVDFGELSNLTELNLSNNELTALPSLIQQLSKLEKLYLYDNPLLNIPPEILGPNWEEVFINGKQPANPQDILRYYFEQQVEGKRPLNEAKLLLLGQGDVGKTSLVKQLVYHTFDPQEGKTHGINIEQWHIPNQRTPNQQIRVNVWDFGGQEIMHATHQFFLTERSLYLIVLKARREVDANRLDYWLQKVQSYGGSSPVLIVLNQIDQHAQELDTRFYEEKYPNLIVGWHKTSCSTNEGIDELRGAIHTHINAFDGVHTPFAKSWFDVKAALEQMSDHYITRDRYTGICHEHDVREPQDQRILLRFMHDLGIALNFDTLELKEAHVLNPHWVTQGVYTILNDSKLVMDKGVLTRQHLQRILHQPTYRHMQRYIVHIMQQFELCFCTPDQKWLIPDLVSPVEPDTGDWDEVLRFRYYYPRVLEPSIMTRFITRMHERIPNHTFWRTGTIIKLDGNRAHIRADRDAKRIDIRIRGHQPTRRGLLAIIREEFRKIHATIPHLLNEEHVPLPDKPEVFVRYKHLLKLEQAAQDTYFPDGADKPVSVATLLNGIEEPTARVRKLERVLAGVRAPTLSVPSSTQALNTGEQAEYQQLKRLKEAYDAPCKGQARWVKRFYRVSFMAGVGLLMWGLAQLVMRLGWDMLEPLTWIVGLGVGLLLWLYPPDSLKPEKVETRWFERRRRDVYAANQFDEVRFAELERKEH